jgi:Fe-S cluster assembly ATP-binding protein
MNKKEILKINNLQASIENKEIIRSLNLSIKENEIHVIMGPNGSGKSTLSKILTGHPSYKIEKGTITFDNIDLLELEPEARAHAGLFLAFQYPIEIPGVTNFDFLRLAYNEKQKANSLKELDPLEFMELTQSLTNKLKMEEEFLNRDVNQGFSGGEKKRNEILQMLLLNPKLIILDEIDSGVDVDAIKVICDNIVKNVDKQSSMIVITHYPRILEYLKPDFVHIMINGNLIKTGGIELVEFLEKNGYESFLDNKK